MGFVPLNFLFSQVSIGFTELITQQYTNLLSNSNC